MDMYVNVKYLEIFCHKDFKVIIMRVVFEKQISNPFVLMS